MPTLVKATIKTLEGASRSVTAWFNPKEFTITKSVTWNQHKGAAKDRPMVQFTTGQPKKLAVELFFDGYEEEKSVRDDCQQLIKMAEMDKGLHRPAEVEFSWASEVFPGVLDNVSVKYTMFLSSGVPVRATASISMQNAKPKRDAKAETQTSSPDFAKLHTLRRGETLHAIAAREYEDAAEWRRIADANGIDDPLDVEPGTKLLLPPIL
jgi:nucleoid-associated protein YgaU